MTGPLLNVGFRRPSLASDTVMVIEQMLQECSPGDRLGTKKELQQRIGVSHGPLNEALRLLQERGMVTLRTGPMGGVFSVEQTPIARFGDVLLRLDSDGIDVTDATRIRLALEQVVLEDAIAHATPEDVTEMRLILDQMRLAQETGDSVGFVKANWALHDAIAKTVKNQLLASIYRGLIELARSRLSAVEPHNPELNLKDFHAERLAVHTEMVDAVELRDRSNIPEIIERHNQEIMPVN